MKPNQNRKWESGKVGKWALLLTVTLSHLLTFNLIAQTGADNKISVRPSTITFQATDYFLINTGSPPRTVLVSATNLLNVLRGLPNWPAGSVTNVTDVTNLVSHGVLSLDSFVGDVGQLGVLVVSGGALFTQLIGENQVVYIDTNGLAHVTAGGADGDFFTRSSGVPSWTNSFNIDLELDEPVPLLSGGSGSALLTPTTNVVMVYSISAGSNVLATLGPNITFNPSTKVLNSTGGGGGGTVSNAAALTANQPLIGVGNGSAASAENFTIIQLTDPHVGFTGWTSNGMVDVIDWIISEKTNQNIKIVISPGDMVDPTGGDITTLTTNWNFLTNQFYRLKNAGISVLSIPGNHESDSGTWNTGGETNFDIYMGTNFFLSDPALVGFRTNTTSRNVVFAQTNSGVPIVYIGLDYPTGLVSSSDWTPMFNWANEQLARFSNHLGIVVMHEFLNQSGELAAEADPLWGGAGYQAWTNLAKAPNLVQTLSAHFRGITANRELIGTAGNSVMANFFNCQQLANQGNKMVRVYNWDVAKRTVHARTFDATAKVYLASTDTTYGGAPFAFAPDYKFPFQKTVGQQQYVTLTANPGSENVGGAHMPTLGTAFTFSRLMANGYYDFWTLGRTNKSGDLELRYGTNWTVAANPVVVSFSTNGAIKFLNQNGPFTNVVIYGDEFRTNIFVISASGNLSSNAVGLVTNASGTVGATMDVTANNNISARNTTSSQVKMGAVGPGVLGGITFGSNTNASLYKRGGGILAVQTNLFVHDNIIATNMAATGFTNIAGVNEDGVFRPLTIGANLSLAANGTLSAAAGGAGSGTVSNAAALAMGSLVVGQGNGAVATTNLLRESFGITNDATGDVTVFTASNQVTTSTSGGREGLLSSGGTFWDTNQFQVDTPGGDNALRVGTNGTTYASQFQGNLRIAAGGTLEFVGTAQEVVGDTHTIVNSTGGTETWDFKNGAAKGLDTTLRSRDLTNLVAGTSNINSLAYQLTNGLNFQGNKVNLAWGGTNVFAISNGVVGIMAAPVPNSAGYGVEIGNAGGGVNVANGGVQIAAASHFIFNGRSRLASGANGTATLRNSAGTDFFSLFFGGVTSTNSQLQVLAGTTPRVNFRDGTTNQWLIVGVGDLLATNIVTATNGFASYSTVATNAIAATGYTNATSPPINQTAYVTATGVSFQIKDRSNNILYTSPTLTATMPVHLQPGWGVTAGSGLTGTVLPE